MASREIKAAVRRGIKARVALEGPAGAGKTFTALAVASGLVGNGKILVIDTERDSAASYADDFTFDAVNWSPPYAVDELVKFLGSLTEYEAVVIDSLTHFWKGEGGILDFVEQEAIKDARGRIPDRFAAWRKGTPLQERMISSITNAPYHVIATMRSKQDYAREERDGKVQIKKLGLAPQQRDDMDFEFTIVGELDMEHNLVITKSRAKPLADKLYRAHQESTFARDLHDWLAGAVRGDGADLGVPESTPSALTAEDAALVDEIVEIPAKAIRTAQETGEGGRIHRELSDDVMQHSAALNAAMRAMNKIADKSGLCCQWGWDGSGSWLSWLQAQSTEALHNYAGQVTTSETTAGGVR